ncbi:MAG: M14 family zinc carboxypeptidase [Bacteroidia bacterium]|nr:M14 family zinc carboxypeptidase [Bacteroidia bacterium]
MTTRTGKTTTAIALALICAGRLEAQTKPDLRTPHEKNGPNYTATHAETVAFYELLAKYFSSKCTLLKYDNGTDVGKPLHLFVAGETDVSKIRDGAKVKAMIVSGIHPGEAEGIDAVMALCRDLLTKKRDLLERLTLLVLPMYNVDGALARGCCSRANQNGPAEHGFRGNGQNLDLNRDFMKADTRNARTFQRIFHAFDPDVFMDNHTTNGADYQHTITIIGSHHSKLDGELGKFIKNDFLPAMYDDMREKGWRLAPYVVSKGTTPDSGIVGFFDTPRFSRGYVSLFNTLGFIAETHMLKPFDERVRATYDLNETLLKTAVAYAERIKTLRKNAESKEFSAPHRMLWKRDDSRADTIVFDGYETTYRISAVTGQRMHYYDRSKPYTRPLPFYDYFYPTLERPKPYAYIVPQAWERVVESLKNNAVAFKRLAKDTVLEVEVKYIESYKTFPEPYEGHYLHYDVKTRTQSARVRFFKGDLFVKLTPRHAAFLMEAFEPEAEDSYFAWNFFDACLMQKESFSPYIFDTTAERLLKQDPRLQQEFELWKSRTNPTPEEQLKYIYQRSPYYEPTHRRYPVATIPKPIELPLTD